MFVGRERELEALEDSFKRNRFEFFVISGRKRIGKSALITEFIKGKPNIFFTALSFDKELNLNLLSQEISQFINHSRGFGSNCSFKEALEEVFQLSLSKRFILVIDEFSNLVKLIPSFPMVLNKLIDKYRDKSKLFLIISGSSLFQKEKEQLNSLTSFINKRTGQVRLAPLSFKEIIQLVPDLSNEQKAMVYGVYGGTPHYINQYNPALNFEDNIRNSFLKLISILFEEPENLIKEKVRDSAKYKLVLKTVAEGHTKVSEIATKTKNKQNLTSYLLNNLVEMDLVEKEYPYQEESSKRPIYNIKDNMFQFWFKFIPKNNNLIYQGYDNLAYLKIEPLLNDYMGMIFEKICQEYLWLSLGKSEFPIVFHSLGRWWGANPKTKEQEKIDIVGEADKNTALFAECKWTNKKVDSHILNNLIRKAQLFDYPIKHYFLFSKSGFSSECIKLAKEIPNVYLITFDEMMELFES